MITIRKLQSLPPSTRRRKIVRLLESWERSGDRPEPRYLRDLARIVASDSDLPAAVREAAERLHAASVSGDPRRTLNSLRHALMAFLGLEPAEWDLLPPCATEQAGRPGAVSPAARVGPVALSGVALYLESIRSPFNVGSILRTAAAFGVAALGLSDESPSLGNARVVRSAMGAEGALETVRGPLDAVAGLLRDRRKCDPPPVIALELGGDSIWEYRFPSEGVLILGSEELGVSPALLARADARVSIALPGQKASLNVGVACGIALAAWQAALVRTPR